MIIWLMFGCHEHVISDYNQWQESELITEAQLEKNWVPDVMLRVRLTRIAALSQELAQKKLSTIQPFSQDILGEKLVFTPEPKLENLVLTPSRNSPNTLGYTGKIGGQVRWKIGPKQGSFALNVPLGGEATLESVDQRLYLRLGQLTEFRSRLPKVLGFSVDELLKEELSSRMSTLPRIEVGQFSGLPIRGMRFQLGKHSADLHFRSTLNHNFGLQAEQEELPSDWELHMHKQSLLQLAQIAAKEKGIIARNISVQPTSIELSPNQYELGVRLWHIAGWRSWWRDYSAIGHFDINQESINLVNDKVKRTGRSPLAALIDPTAIFAEGVIVSAISENLTYTDSPQQEQVVNSYQLTGNVDSVITNSDAFVVQGSFDFLQPVNAKKAPKKGLPKRK